MIRPLVLAAVALGVLAATPPRPARGEVAAPGGPTESVVEYDGGDGTRITVARNPRGQRTTRILPDGREYARHEMSGSHVRVEVKREAGGRLHEATLSRGGRLPPGTEPPPPPPRPVTTGPRPPLAERAVLGEPCLEREEQAPGLGAVSIVCEAADGLVLSRRGAGRDPATGAWLSWSDPRSPLVATAVRVERRAVPDGEVLPPPSLLDLAAWQDPGPPPARPAPEGGAEIWYRRENLRPGGPARLLVLGSRRRLDVAGASGAVERRYEDTAVPVALLYRTFPVGGESLVIARPRDAREPPSPLTGTAGPPGGLAARLGERCEEQGPSEATLGVGVTPSVVECRTADGLLLRRRTSRLTNFVPNGAPLPYVVPAAIEEAVSLRRGGVDPADLAPPADLLDPARWDLGR